MRLKKEFLLYLLSCFYLQSIYSQTCTIANPDNIPTPVFPIPTEGQMRWHEVEMYAFIHFGINTFTGLEWGNGSEQPSRFAPTAKVDIEQWVTTCKNAGLKGIILTCKHHDGFCLWYTKSTTHSTEYSSGNGKIDIPRLLSDECQKQGLKFGIYISPWDRNNADYGRPGYMDVYRMQIEELCSNYGDLFEIWFDGANGGDGYYGGSWGTRTIDANTYYDWPNTFAIIRKHQPNIVIWGSGSDARWIGNEQGWAGETNWCCVNEGGENYNATEGEIDGTEWIPGESDVSIRGGWFWHPNQDAQVKTPEKLFSIYLETVGRNSNLILNIPPNQAGRFADADIAALQGWKNLMDARLSNDLALTATATSTAYRSGGNSLYIPSKVNDGDINTYWAQEDGTVTAEIQLTWNASQSINYISLQEYIRLGQRVKSFEVDSWNGSSWVKQLSATTIGYKRILKFDSQVNTTKIRVRITDSKVAPLIHTISVY